MLNLHLHVGQIFFISTSDMTHPIESQLLRWTSYMYLPEETKTTARLSSQINKMTLLFSFVFFLQSYVLSICPSTGPRIIKGSLRQTKLFLCLGLRLDKKGKRKSRKVFLANRLQSLDTQNMPQCKTKRKCEYSHFSLLTLSCRKKKPPSFESCFHGQT